MDQPQQAQPPYFNDEIEIDLRQYAAVLWRWKWLLIAGTLLAALAAFLVSRSTTPVYQATTTLLINQAPDAQTSDYNAILTSERQARTYAQMLSRRPILEATLNELNLDTEVSAFQEQVTVELVRDTQLIEVAVENTDPRLAASLANTLVEVFTEELETLQAERYAASKASLQAQIADLESQMADLRAQIEAIGQPVGEDEQAELQRLEGQLTQLRSSHTALLQSFEELRLAEAQSVSNVVVIDPAVANFNPVSPRTLINTLLAAVVGGMLALGGVFLIEYLDHTVKRPEDVERHLGLAIIGTIAAIEGNGEAEGPFVARQPRSPVAEAFRALRTNLGFAAVDHELRTLLITSPGPEEGKSTVSANLASVMAQGGRSTILLEADLRRPKVHRLVGIPGEPGLSDLFVQNPLSLEGALLQTEVEGLRAIAGGELPPNPAELLGSQRMTEILAAMKQEADIVVIDSAPVTIVTDPVVLSSRVDGVLLVIEPGKTELGAAEHAVESLRRARANLIGVVFNNVPPDRAGYYGDYRYQYAEGYARERDDGGAK